jgi:hypothetical protein
MNIDELEAALAASFDHELLAIYADALQSMDDPRGELIAIDLHMDEHGSTAELVARRRTLIKEWLGELAISPYVRVRHGFLELMIWRHVRDRDPDGLDAGVLATPAGQYVRGVEVNGDKRVIQSTIAALARTARPWLSSLKLRPHSNRGPVMVAQRTTNALIKRTPQLESLEVFGRRVLGEFVHPNLRKLVVSGHDAIGTLSGTGPATMVSELEFAFHCDSSDEDTLRGLDPDALAALLPIERFPMLRRLDLSHNEPGFCDPPNNLGGAVPVFRFVRNLAVARQLTHLRLPSLRSEAQQRDVQAALDRMPGLVELQIARNHGHAVNLRHATASVSLPPAVAWPPLDSLHTRDGLWIKLPGAHGYDVDVRGAVKLMESSYAKLPSAARAAWDDFWDFLDGLYWEDEAGNTVELPFCAAVLVRALEPADLSDHRRWTELREALHAAAFAPSANLVIHRYWGW